MPESARDAVERAWQAFIRVRGLCPAATDSVLGRTEYESPGWYRHRGIHYYVRMDHPFEQADLAHLGQMTSFVNRSFIITVAAVLESYGILSKHAKPRVELDGAKHVELVRRLRNHFAHGEYELDDSNPGHVVTRELLEQVLPAAASSPGFPASIDNVLEPLKNGVLDYLDAIGRSV